MSRNPSCVPSSWDDRFARPTPEGLIGALPEEERELVALAREALREDAEERVEWRGVAYKWCLVYRRARKSADSAFLVPQPNAVRLCLPIPTALLPGLASIRLSAGIRDSIVFAPEVDAVRWPEWRLSSRGFVDEIIEVVRAMERLPREEGVGTT